MLSPSKIFMEEASIYLRHQKRQIATKILSVPTATSFALHGTEEVELGGLIFYRICNHIVAHILTAVAQNSYSAVAESGLSMKLATGRPGDVQSIQQLFITPKQVWNTISAKSI